MTAFNPISPRVAMNELEAAGIVPADQALADFAEAGLVKGYAKLIETINPSGLRHEVRDKRISRALWRQIIAEQRVAEVEGATVRLDGAAGYAGCPKTNIIGIRFGPMSVASLKAGHGVSPTPSRPSSSTTANSQQQSTVNNTKTTQRAAADEPATSQERASSSGIKGIPEGAELCTVEQACVATSLGRTSINALMKAGTLERRKFGSATRITVASLRRVIENRSQD